MFLAACASTPGPAPARDDALAGRLAALAQAVCLPAQDAGLRVGAHLEANGGAPAHGLRPAAPPATGWVLAADPRVGVAEVQSACVVSADPPPLGSTEALLAALRPVGTLGLARRARPGVTAWPHCRSGKLFTVLAGEGPDGATLAVAVPDRAVPCGMAPPVPGVAPR